MAPKPKKSQPKAPELPKEYKTIAEQHLAEYRSSIPYQVLFETKGFAALTAAEKQGYAYTQFLLNRTWRGWSAAQQKEFWALVEKLKIPIPLPKPRDLGKDFLGRDIGSYTPAEYRLWREREDRLSWLRIESGRFRATRERERDSDLEKGGSVEKKSERVQEAETEEERTRRREIAQLRGKAMGRYESDPEWDDVVPIPQDDGEGALAQIAYTDEYSEAMGYLRAIMASEEHSPRVLSLTEHIINLNAAHYTVWLYRASTLFALNSSIRDELAWLNDIALDNQKNYQIWHHRQLLLDNLYPTISSDPAALKELADSEIDFMTEMFNEDAKNYHVWSYRQYFVRKLDLFGDAELKSIEKLLRMDVRNNSAWSHRFFIVFSDPSYSTPDSKATEHDPKIPSSIIDREIEFGKAATFEAPQNQSPWNYIRGVLRKGGRKLSSLECFAGEFVKIPADGEGEEDVRSSHALDFLADCWSEMGKTNEADKALVLLAEKYDPIRKNYWEWRRLLLKEGKTG